MNTPFTKMHGLGNDFMVIDATRHPYTLSAADLVAMSNRFTGIGFDQCLVIEPGRQAGIDFNYRIFNANGHEVGQCGNGARCLARYVYERGLTRKTTIQVATCTTQMTLQVLDNNQVKITMPTPELSPAAIPLNITTQATTYELPLTNMSVPVHALNVGNPHAVVRVMNDDGEEIKQWGQLISEHPLFPEQVNAGFMHIITPNHLKLRVYERGCGETLACGSGAVAAAAVGRLYYDMAPTITVSLPGGDLTIEWAGGNAPIYLIGPAVFVYEGIWFTEQS